VPSMPGQRVPSRVVSASRHEPGQPCGPRYRRCAEPKVKSSVELPAGRGEALPSGGRHPEGSAAAG
jgi:hypothetical protein